MDGKAQHRAVFDSGVGFGNGGGPRGRDFRLDIDGAGIDDPALARKVVADLRLLMVDTVHVSNTRIVVEPHKRPVSALQNGERQ